MCFFVFKIIGLKTQGIKINYLSKKSKKQRTSHKLGNIHQNKRFDKNKVINLTPKLNPNGWEEIFSNKGVRNSYRNILQTIQSLGSENLE